MLSYRRSLTTGVSEKNLSDIVISNQESIENPSQVQNSFYVHSFEGTCTTSTLPSAVTAGERSFLQALNARVALPHVLAGGGKLVIIEIQSGGTQRGQSCYQRLWINLHGR